MGKPGDISNFMAVDFASLEPSAPAKYRVVMAKDDQALAEREQICVNFFPVVPGNFVILAVGVIVALLCPRNFVAAKEHGYSLGKEQGGKKIALLAGAQFQYFGVIGCSLNTTVPGTVVICAVLVVFTVGFIMFFIVGDQILQREAIVGGDKVDAGEGETAGILVEIRATGKAGCKLAECFITSRPEVAYTVAVTAVPLAPHRRKVANLITTFANVPGLGDQLDLADHRVLLDQIEEG